jgi:hypothetical protein
MTSQAWEKKGNSGVSAFKFRKSCCNSAAKTFSKNEAKCSGLF